MQRSMLCPDSTRALPLARDVTRIDDSSPKRATSRDGTEIAYWTSGSGPPLVLVHGAPADHTRWRPLLPFLEPHATVHAMDRRGRGASGDGREYRLEVLEGQQHVADILAPEVFAAHLVAFLRDER